MYLYMFGGTWVSFTVHLFSFFYRRAPSGNEVKQGGGQQSINGLCGQYYCIYICLLYIFSLLFSHHAPSGNEVKLVSFLQRFAVSLARALAFRSPASALKKIAVLLFLFYILKK